jgi:hypothetical protein
VHHVTLIHTIQRTHGLPLDPAIELYLGEMIRYTPGSHVLAATVASWFRLDALRVVHPVMAASVALKCALLFLVTLRMLPASRSPLHAVTAPILVMAPADHCFGFILKYGFYAQVVSETFAIGMLLATVLWVRDRARIWLILFALCGCATFLAWPVWLPLAVLAFFVSVMLQRPPLRDTVRDLLVAIGPIVVVGALHVMTHTGGASILSAAGGVTTPSWEVLGVGFVPVAAAGAVLALQKSTDAWPWSLRLRWRCRR